jgi:hypothetical protein
MVKRFGKIDFHLICRLGELTRNEMRVLLYLYVCRNEETKQCNPNRKVIAADIKIDKGNLSKAIAGLEKKGWILEVENGQFTLFEAPQIPRKVVEILTERIVDSTTIVVEPTTESCRTNNPHIKEIEQKTNIEGTEKRLADKSASFVEQQPFASSDKTTDKAATPPQTGRSPEFKPFREALFSYHKKRLNDKVADHAAQNAAICWLFDNDFSRDDCLVLYGEQMKELKPNGWRWKVSWLTVKQDIADWVSQGKPILEGKNEQSNKTTNGNRINDQSSEISDTSDFLRSIGARPAEL